MPHEAQGLARGPSVIEVASMRQDGFVRVRNFFSAAEMVEILDWTAQLQAAPETLGRHWVYREASLTHPDERVLQRIENFCPFHAGFDRLIRDSALTHWTSALMGGPALLFKEKINFKMPGGAGFTAHQDQQAGWGRYAPIFLTAMVTLDAATLGNGCLEIAPGRHREGLIGEEWKPLGEEGLALHPVPTEPGDVIFFDSFTPHASRPNLTASARRILYLTYNLASDGDHRRQYYADKHAAFPPDIEREQGKSYVFRV